jgi:hypothetical protein
MAVFRHEAHGMGKNAWVLGGVLVAALFGALIGSEATVVPALAVGAIAVVVILLAVPVAFRDSPSLLSSEFVIAWTLTALGVRIITGLVIASWPSATNFLGPDAIGYQRDALGLLSAWHGTGLAPILPAGKGGFSIMLAGLYWLTGPQLSAGVVLNAFLGAALVPILADTTYRAGEARAARYACPLVALLPLFVVWSSELLREAGVWVLMAIMLNCGVRMASSISVRRIVLAGLAAAGLFTFRASVAIVYIPTLALGVLIASRRPRSSGSRLPHLVALMALSAVSIWIVVLMYRGGFQADLRDVENYRNAVAIHAGSGFNAGADVSTPGAALSYLPIGAARLLLGPFPWDLRSTTQAVGLVAAITSWVLLYWFVGGARGWRSAHGSDQARVGRSVFLIPAAALTVLLSLVSGNYGLAIRERSQILLVALPVICFGIARRRERAWNVDAALVDRPGRMLQARSG